MPVGATETAGPVGLLVEDFGVPAFDGACFGVVVFGVLVVGCDGDGVDFGVVVDELDDPPVLTLGAAPPALRPARAPQTGQAPGPCMLSRFSATAICWSLVAWFAFEAYCPPPAPSHELCENWRPP